MERQIINRQNKKNNAYMYQRFQFTNSYTVVALKLIENQNVKYIHNFVQIQFDPVLFLFGELFAQILNYTH